MASFLTTAAQRAHGKNWFHGNFVPVTAAVDVIVVVAVVKTLINVLCTVDRRLLNCIAWCTRRGKV